MHVDVAVVGGGAIGLAAARAAALAGADTHVFERHPQGSVRSCCTGLVSPRTLSTLGVSQRSVLQEIRAVRIHLPSDKVVSLRSDQVKAFAVCRESLEAELLATARQAGAHIQFAAEVTGVERGKVHVKREHGSETISASTIIGADGPTSQVAKWLGLGQISMLVSAVQVELSMADASCDEVAVFVGQDVAPGFFGWSVPAEEGIRRVGIGVLPPHSPTPFLNRLLAKHYPTASTRSQSAGWIPLAPAHPSAIAGALLVGDAAGHVKPLSGGGLYTGGACALIAGEIAAANARPGADTTHLSTAYPKRCLDVIGKEQAFGKTLRHYLTQLRDEDMDAAAEALSDPRLLQFLADHADIDHFHRLPDQLAAEPSLWTTLLRLVPLLGR